jgi:hypothetical protein
MSFGKCWNKQVKRRELILRMVLNEISDDFENVDQIIVPHLAESCRKLGLTIDRAEIVKVLAGLVEDGLAKVYDLRNGTSRDPFSGELPSIPSLDKTEEDFPYFYITKKGMDFHRSDDTWWPFDDDDERRIGAWMSPPNPPSKRLRTICVLPTPPPRCPHYAG